MENETFLFHLKWIFLVDTNKCLQQCRSFSIYFTLTLALSLAFLTCTNFQDDLKPLTTTTTTTISSHKHALHTDDTNAIVNNHSTGSILCVSVCMGVCLGVKTDQHSIYDTREMQNLRLQNRNMSQADFSNGKHSERPPYSNNINNTNDK